MGLLVKGEWHDQWYDTSKSGGEFVREDSQFRGCMDKDTFVAEPNRYHLYVSYACPWAHRTLIFRTLKKLDKLISVSAVHPNMLANGWAFQADAEYGTEVEPLYGFEHMHQIYTKAKSDYTGRVTVPVLWDKQQQTIVCNESAEIIRLLNTAFNDYTDVQDDFYPAALRAEIDEVNASVYADINNGVYRCGFATTQDAYERAYQRLFAALDKMEARLAQQRYLVGTQLTEADWRLFTTLIRFDAVYYGHFKCNRQRIQDYPNLSNYVRELYQYPGVAETVHFDHIKQHYYYSHNSINPHRIVPVGPSLDFTAEHNRSQFESN